MGVGKGIFDRLLPFVMELVEGDTLATRLASGIDCLSTKCFRYGTQMADAVAAAHVKGIVIAI